MLSIRLNLSWIKLKPYTNSNYLNMVNELLMRFQMIFHHEINKRKKQSTFPRKCNENSGVCDQQDSIILKHHPKPNKCARVRSLYRDFHYLSDPNKCQHQFIDK